MNRRLLGIAGLVVVGLPLVALLVTVLVNCFDQSLSPETAAILNEKTVSVPDESNLYLALFGLDRSSDTPLTSSGRHVLMEAAASEAAFLRDPQGGVPALQFSPADYLQAEGNFDWCNPESLESWKVSVDELRDVQTPALNAELLRRYLSLPMYKGYSDEMATEPFRVPNLRAATCLFLAREIVGLQGDASTTESSAKEVMSDIRVWTLALSRGEDYPGRSIAVSQLRHDFSLLVDAERTRPATVEVISRLLVSDPPWSTPENWGATRTFDRTARKIAAMVTDIRTQVAFPSAGLWERIYNPLVMHFLKPNATANLAADSARHLATAAKAPPAELASRLNEATAWIGSRSFGSSSLTRFYNPLGRMFGPLASDVDADLPLRLEDGRRFEQMARLVLTAHADGVWGPSVVEFMIRSPDLGKDPVTGKPFAYDPTSNVVEFQGLARYSSSRRFRLPV